MSLKKTVPGGCNLAFDLKRSGSEVDTAIFTLENDTLDIFIGLNFACCTPFNASLTTKSDSIIITATDICPAQGTCYCHCICYYTWNFLLVDFAEKVYDYKVLFKSTLNEGPVIIQEGKITISGNTVLVQ